MHLDRRLFMGGGVALGAASVAGSVSAEAKRRSDGIWLSAHEFGIKAGLEADQSNSLQRAIDTAAKRDVPLHIPAGRYRAANLQLRSGAILLGIPGATTIEFSGGGNVLRAQSAEGLHIEGIIFDGTHRLLDVNRGMDALITFTDCSRVRLDNIVCRNSLLNGASLRGVSGSIWRSTFEHCDNTGLFVLDANGVDITHSHIAHCGNNGVQVWRSSPGEDGTIVTNNRIEHIKAESGGSGQNGNGINMFRADAVLVSANRITDCAFSAIRANASSNCQMIANSCTRLGEVALYAEFGFQGALIAQNVVDTAATGIVVTNFNEGGRLAVVEGNLVRNLFRRELSEDKRGNGIAVEADTAVSGNVIENAPSAGIAIGWGKYMRNVTATGNIVRQANIGIAVSADRSAGHVLLANNVIDLAPAGAIRTMDLDRPIGPDLARSNARPAGNITLQGNIAD